MAKPRSPAPNQRITARPLAPFTLPPSTPTSASPAASAHNGGTEPSDGVIHSSKVNSASMVPSKPVSSTGRSPQRSVAMPHGNSVRATPRPMAPSATPSCVLLR